MIRVFAVMTENPATVSPDTPLRVARDKMQQGRFRRLPVVQNGKLVGIISDRDLRRATNSPLVLRERWYDAMILDHVQVLGAMTPNPITVEADAPLVDAVRLMHDNKVGGLPVMRNGLLVGIITETDIMQYMILLLEKEENAATKN